MSLLSVYFDAVCDDGCNICAIIYLSVNTVENSIIYTCISPRGSDTYISDTCGNPRRQNVAAIELCYKTIASSSLHLINILN